MDAGLSGLLPIGLLKVEGFYSPAAHVGPLSAKVTGIGRSIMPENVQSTSGKETPKSYQNYTQNTPKTH